VIGAGGALHGAESASARSKECMRRMHCMQTAARVKRSCISAEFCVSHAAHVSSAHLVAALLVAKILPWLLTWIPHRTIELLYNYYVYSKVIRLLRLSAGRSGFVQAADILCSPALACSPVLLQC
jgi:hypothetical protein